MALLWLRFASSLVSAVSEGESVSDETRSRVVLVRDLETVFLGTALGGAVSTAVAGFSGASFLRATGFAWIGLILACFGLGSLIYTNTAKYLVPALGERRMVIVGASVMSMRFHPCL